MAGVSFRHFNKWLTIGNLSLEDPKNFPFNIVRAFLLMRTCFYNKFESWVPEKWLERVEPLNEEDYRERVDSHREDGSWLEEKNMSKEGK